LKNGYHRGTALSDLFLQPFPFDRQNSLGPDMFQFLKLFQIGAGGGRKNKDYLAFGQVVPRSLKPHC
jgi:hypothetical protein